MLLFYFNFRLTQAENSTFSPKKFKMFVFEYIDQNINTVNYCSMAHYLKQLNCKQLPVAKIVPILREQPEKNHRKCGHFPRIYCMLLELLLQRLLPNRTYVFLSSIILFWNFGNAFFLERNSYPRLNKRHPQFTSFLN